MTAATPVAIRPRALVETLSTRKPACTADLAGRTLSSSMSTSAPARSANAPIPARLVDPDFTPSPTLTIDTASAPGSWARAIRETPHLAAQMKVGAA